MPLPESYNVERSKYLEQYLRNLEKAKEEFSQRWINKYNADFPYSENSLPIDTNINEQPIISEIRTPINDINYFRDLLHGYLYELSKNNDIVNYILDNLDEPSIIYLANNWKSVRSTIKKTIIPPISKEDFLIKLLTMIKGNKEIQNSIEADTNTRNMITKPPAKDVGKDLQVFLSSLKIKELKEFIESTDLKMRTNNRTKDELINEIYTRLLDKYTADEVEDILLSNRPSRSFPTPKKTGKGIDSKHRVVFNHKYAIDTKLLEKNLLSLKYSSTGNPHQKFRKTLITDNGKEFVKNLIVNNKPSNELFEKLDFKEKRLMNRLCEYLDLDSELSYDDDFQKNFNILYGSYLAGNDSIYVKNQLKKYILTGIQENSIPKHTGYNMLLELAMT